MKILVIFYSYSGKTRIIAEGLAKRENADLVEVGVRKPLSKFRAYVSGSLAARRQREADLLDFQCDFTAYEKIIIAMPIWAAFPAPPFSNIVKALPRGKEVKIVATSGSGSSGGSAENTKKRLADKGCTVAKYTNIKTQIRHCSFGLFTGAITVCLSAICLPAAP